MSHAIEFDIKANIYRYHKFVLKYLENCMDKVKLIALKFILGEWQPS